jgi:nucleoside-diphosphate-sugar epimerase
MENILVIGASGQIGSELVMALRKVYGDSHVFATDIKDAPKDVMESGPFQILDAMDDQQLTHFVVRHKITQIYHLAAVLSGNAEKIPLKAWDINMKSLLQALNICREMKIKKFFWPSSIAVFGPTTPRVNTPQYTVMEPTTVYGISKLAGERWMEYFNKKYNLDTRSIRYPGLISYKTEAGGGTTDYAVEIYYEAIRNKKYECFLQEGTILPMMFMEDAINATIELMELPEEKVLIRSSYNVAGISFAPEDVAASIRKHIPEFEMTYKPDFRQAIADSWPQSIDDSYARANDGWKHMYDLDLMTEVMLQEIQKKLK